MNIKKSFLYLLTPEIMKQLISLFHFEKSLKISILNFELKKFFFYLNSDFKSSF